MKTLIPSESEVLRTEIHQLRATVAELEYRLAEHEIASDFQDENPWGIWPYCWVVAAWEKGQAFSQSVQEKLESLNAKDRETRLRGLADQTLPGELHLT